VEPGSTIPIVNTDCIRSNTSKAVMSQLEVTKTGMTVGGTTCSSTKAKSKTRKKNKRQRNILSGG